MWNCVLRIKPLSTICVFSKLSGHVSVYCWVKFWEELWLHTLNITSLEQKATQSWPFFRCCFCSPDPFFERYKGARKSRNCRKTYQKHICIGWTTIFGTFRHSKSVLPVFLETLLLVVKQLHGLVIWKELLRQESVQHGKLSRSSSKMRHGWPRDHSHNTCRTGVRRNTPQAKRS